MHYNITRLSSRAMNRDTAHTICVHMDPPWVQIHMQGTRHHSKVQGTGSPTYNTTRVGCTTAIHYKSTHQLCALAVGLLLSGGGGEEWTGKFRRRLAKESVGGVLTYSRWTGAAFGGGRCGSVELRR